MSLVEDVRSQAKSWAAVPRHLLELLRPVAVAVVAAVLIRGFLVAPFYIPSGSMEPTLSPGDYILVNRLIYFLHPPQRGDIIVFRFPRDEHWDFVKRIIGLPGDLVEERDGHMFVNGRSLRETYMRHSVNGVAPATDLAPLRIPPRQLFVLGDNRDASLDSRFWGTVDEHEVIGKAFVIYWSHDEEWWNIRWGRIGRWLG
jgi:signal peptidase I